MAFSSFLLPILAMAAPAEGEEVLLEDTEWADEASPAGEAAYPAMAVLDAFATACSGIEMPAVAKASLQAAGWEPIEPATDSRIGQILFGGLTALEAASAADPDAHRADPLANGVYRKDVSGRELFAIVSGVRFDDIASYGCRIYDLDAPAAIASDDLEHWAVRAPKDIAIGIPGATKHTWNPGLKPGHMEMEVSFVPQGTKLPPPLSDIPLSGLVLTASAMEFFDL